MTPEGNGTGSRKPWVAVGHGSFAVRQAMFWSLKARLLPSTYYFSPHRIPSVPSFIYWSTLTYPRHQALPLKVKVKDLGTVLLDKPVP